MRRAIVLAILLSACGASAIAPPIPPACVMRETSTSARSSDGATRLHYDTVDDSASSYGVCLERELRARLDLGAPSDEAIQQAQGDCHAPYPHEVLYSRILWQMTDAEFAASITRGYLDVETWADAHPALYIELNSDADAAAATIAASVLARVVARLPTYERCAALARVEP